MSGSSISLLELVTPYIPHLSLTLLVWITYWYSIRTGFVSDDLAGVAEYDGHLQTSGEKPEHRAWPIWKRLMHTEYGMVSRWIRYHICGGSYPSTQRFIKPDGSKGDFIPIGKTPMRHHILSIVVFNLASLFLFSFLTKIVGVKLAFMTVSLLIFHPITTQGVAWISGLGYPLSLLWMACILNLVHWYYQAPHTTIEAVAVYAVFGLLYFLAVNALFVALCLWPLLIYFGWYPFGAIGAVVSAYLAFNIVKQTINLRAGEFTKQNMGHTIRPKFRKIVVALKTLLYYLKMTLWPDKLGLYHKWGTVYDENIEREDKMMLGGLVALIGLVTWAVLGGPIVLLGIFWFFAFICIFLNWITIQQFVTERYLMIPAIGLYLVVAYYLQDHLSIFYVICGLLLMRTWMHLPTYDNELRFYQSNTWNFQDSEIAHNNLGCTWVRLGWVQSGIDTWTIAQRINPEYDVTFYNVASHFMTNGRVTMNHGNYAQAIEFFKVALEKLNAAINVPRCHFKEAWTKERDEIANYIQNPLSMVQAEKQRNEQLKTEFQVEFDKADPVRKAQLDQSIKDCIARLVHCDQLLSQKPPDAPTPAP